MEQKLVIVLILKGSWMLKFLLSLFKKSQNGWKVHSTKQYLDAKRANVKENVKCINKIKK